MMTIKNYEEIVEELTNILMQLDKELNEHETDIYLYYDKEKETATLDTFYNVGGNSWLNDEHYTIYTDPQHCDEMLDYWEDIAAIADALDMTEDELVKSAADYSKQETEDIDRWDVEKFIEKSPEYFDRLTKQYESIIDDNKSEYAEQAMEIIDRWLEV